MSFVFRQFDDGHMNATRAAWMLDAIRGHAFPPETQRLLDWADDRREPSEDDSTAYGLFPKGKRAAAAICEVVIQRKSARSKWVKMLRLYLKPSIDAELLAGQPESAMAVFAHCIAGVLGLQSVHQANTLKVYGRTNPQLTFLRALVSQIEQQLPVEAKHRLKATIEGRFLSIVVS